MYVIDGIADIYHSQRNNSLFPYSVCGTTVTANVLHYLSKRDKLFYVHDDDEVFKVLNSDTLIKKAEAYITGGEVWMKKYLKHRGSTDYTHLNNLMIMLGEVGKYLTNYTYAFTIKYRSFKSIFESLYVDKMPLIVSGQFTKSGHYVLLIGEDLEDNGSLIFHDPYGDWNTNYKEHMGKMVKYTIEDLIESAFIKHRIKWINDKPYILTLKPTKVK